MNAVLMSEAAGIGTVTTSATSLLTWALTSFTSIVTWVLGNPLATTIAVMFVVGFHLCHLTLPPSSIFSLF